MNILDFSVNEIKAFVLILIRLSGIIFAAPILGSNLILSRAKIAFAGVLALTVFPTIDYTPVSLPDNLAGYLLIVTAELFFGLILGFLFNVVFIGIQFAGQIIGTQMGFGIVSVLDPQANIQISIIGQFQFLTALLIFLSLNGHYVIVEAALECFRIIPPGEITFQAAFQEKAIQITGWVFIYLFKLGAPVVIALYVTEISLGVIARTVPQMNIFIVGFPLKVGVGLFALILVMPLWAYSFEKLLAEFSKHWLVLINVFK